MGWSIDFLERKEQLKQMAEKYKWGYFEEQEDIFMISFMQKGNRINIYYSKMTVATCIYHPKRGKTQLIRRNVSYELMEKIFENPRIHTQKGYYRKWKNANPSMSTSPGRENL